MKQVLLLVVITALAGCGGVNKFKREGSRGIPRSAPVLITPAPAGTTAAITPVEPVALPFARGPIHSACLASDRKARSRERCGCIQAVADRTLSSSQQKVAVSFYSDPQKAQDMRQSDRPVHESFWLDYKAYGETAERICR